jgi:hypothetical protein
MEFTISRLHNSVSSKTYVQFADIYDGRYEFHIMKIIRIPNETPIKLMLIPMK